MLGLVKFLYPEVRVAWRGRGAGVCCRGMLVWGNGRLSLVAQRVAPVCGEYLRMRRKLGNGHFHTKTQRQILSLGAGTAVIITI